MIYSSPEYLALFIPTLLAFLLIREHAFRHSLLLGASLAFYAWAGLHDTIVFVFVVAVSWGSVWAAHRWTRHRTVLLRSGIVVMLLHLFLWKYASWLVGETQRVFPHFLGGEKLRLGLPVGISFFTLQGIAYLVDYGRAGAGYMSFSRFLLFKSFFAQLVAGPIVRARELAPQLASLRSPHALELAQGLALFCLGLFKKIAIADRCGLFVDTVFVSPSDYDRTTLLLAVVGYSVQIWGDFSGYTDMGRGSARMLGISLPENFLSPYLARSPSEFWRRWHITLSEWIRDYVYIPLGGSRGTFLRTCTTAMITMVVSGLWHGANWTFLLWGAYHGLLLTGERVIGRSRASRLFQALPTAVRAVLALAVMQSCTCFGWLLFRADGITDLLSFMRSLGAGTSADAAPGARTILVCAFLCFGIQGIGYRDLGAGTYPVLRGLQSLVQAHGWDQPQRMRLAGTCCGLLLALFLIVTLFFRHASATGAFIYFRF